MKDNQSVYAADGKTNDTLDVLLLSAHKQLGITVNDRLMAQGGVPELRDPDLALDRLLAAAHRAAGHAVTARLTHEAPEGAAGEAAPPMPLAVDGALGSRPAAVRLKYRRDALRIARAYWPRDLISTLQTTLRILEQLSDMVESATEPASLACQAREFVEQLDARFTEVLLLPKPRRRPTELTGTDYLAAVEIHLARPAEQLLHAMERARQFMDDELTPLLTTIDDTATGNLLGTGYLLGVEAVTQDLYDDLDRASSLTVTLSKAVAEVERISSDFVGADLRHANLNGVLLKGIRWDAATMWPDGWEALIRRVSLPVGGEQGVLIVRAEPHESAIPADA